MKTKHVKSESLPSVIIRFAGDSGDGMQVTGAEFTKTAALMGNDTYTLPDFPAEIRAPAGTLAGVSGFQLQFSDSEIHTAGDQIDILIAMNPAALKVNLQDLKKHGTIVINSDGFTKRDLTKAKYTENPLEDNSLHGFRVFEFPITSLTLNAVEGKGLTHSAARKCKNMFALGLLDWLYTRPLNQTEDWIQEKFSGQAALIEANIAALRAGYNFADITEVLTEQFNVAPAVLPAGTYRQITGNEALVLGALAASIRSKTPLFLAGYPITPSSDILHYMAQYQNLGVKVFQAEDEIAAACAAIGAAYGGSLALTCTSGPGFDLKSESIGLAVMTELPLVLIDVQRAGPSTGMPTKTEQADLLMAMYGRHGESPLPILAPKTPSDCFDIMLEACRIAIKFMTPVIVLSDSSLANAAEPWLLPDIDALPELPVVYRSCPKDFSPYQRDPETLARPWVKPGTKGLEHRIGGLEKDSVTGDVSYDPENHQKMCAIRADKIAGIAKDYPPVKIFGEARGELLVIGWGSTYGAIHSSVEQLQMQGKSISAIHLRHLNPFPNDLKTILNGFTSILVPELNRGQLSQLLRAEYLIDVKSFTKVKGKPFLINEITQKILGILS